MESIQDNLQYKRVKAIEELPDGPDKMQMRNAVSNCRPLLASFVANAWAEGLRPEGIQKFLEILIKEEIADKVKKEEERLKKNP